MNKNISIIGCGWLGLPLAKHLISDGYQVKGSTTSAEKIEDLKSFGIDAFYVELTQNGIKGAIEKCLLGSEILVLNIPPGLRKNPDYDFVKQMQFLLPYIEKSTIKKVLFISSTSVYDDQESFPIITEKSVTNPNSAAGKQLLEVERLFQNHKQFQTTILRFGGLFGEDRHPATYLSGRNNLKNPNAPVNLIHLDDCIGIITNILKQAVWYEVFNASTPTHPSKQEYYTAVCKAKKIPLPLFDNATSSVGKYIDSTKVEQVLNYDFQVTLE